ncbi:MAG: beta-ketoacyl-[acyl-carrier-protein] synthase family protein [Proteobacteria bacterium]|nr:beta-ketoacyl-[acyl-carrier-protein] synthase family protein [Pseudomonadota bacterium]MBU4472073.1 beta-ketoacyl-[acyl-carrier-protein] synthase family protein [Pseudomonadota bacterium]MCG2752929.1 beta-ketoacyl-[acyl-carrier-protein] synthase family protein [Desulfobacteraceae bacterium]
MNGVYITQVKAITALGPDLDALYEGLLKNRTGIREVTRFDTKNYISPYAALIGELDPKNSSSLIFELSDRLMDQLTGIDSDCFLITASTKAAIDLIERNNTGTQIGSEVLPSSLPGYIANQLGLKDQGINISAACASSTIALAKAASLITQGHAEAVLVCCMDIISEFVFAGFSALQAMSPFPATPFDKKRQGLTLGEGAAALVLMSEQKINSMSIRPLARICGWGIANDATHITAPARDGRGLKLAINHACKQAAIAPEEICAISAHGTGTVYNDLMEIQAINSIFSENPVIVNSIKGAIGHTLGAAGGIEAALCVKILENKMMPGTVGFNEPEEGAENLIASEPKRVQGDYILTTNSGFGGINAAIIIK